MTPRLFAALALFGSLLHLNVARADGACVDHGEHAAPSAPVHHAATGDHASHPSDAPEPDATQDTPCGAPTAPVCCQALASCSPVLGIDPGAPVEHCDRVPDRVVSAATDALSSAVTVPDPPPPKP